MSEPANLRELLTVPVDLLDEDDDAIRALLEQRQEQRRQEEAEQRAERARKQKERAAERAREQKEREQESEHRKLEEAEWICQDEDIQRMCEEPVRMMFEQPLVRENAINELVGLPGHGKSAIGACALYSAATGVTTVLKPLGRPRPAFGLLTESSVDYRERISAIAKHYGVPRPRHLRLVPQTVLLELLNEDGGFDSVRRAIRVLLDEWDMDEPLIVVDCLRHFTRTGDSLLHDEVAEPLMRQLQAEFDASLLIIHGANDYGKPYGAKVLQYEPEIWSVIKQKGSEATIRNGKNRGGVLGNFRVRFHGLSDDVFILVPASGERKAKAGKEGASPSELEKLHAYVVEIYGEHDFGFNKLHTRIKGERRISRDKVRRLLIEGINSGLFVQPMERGPYRAILKSGSLPSIKTTKTSTG